jgi:hypothetical protein
MHPRHVFPQFFFCCVKKSTGSLKKNPHMRPAASIPRKSGFSSEF